MSSGKLKGYVVKGFVSPYFLFAVVALVILGPLLCPGYILTVDSLIALNRDTVGYFYGLTSPSSVFGATHNSAPVFFLLSLMAKVIPLWAVEKAWLWLLFWLCGIGAFRLPFLSGVGRYYAGVLYMVNPFTYIRFVSGQWGVLAAYALTPFAIGAFISLMQKGDGKQAVKLALITSLVALTQVHGVVILFLALAILFVIKAISAPSALLSLSKVASVSGSLFLIINLYWLLPLFTSMGNVLQNITDTEFRFFAACSISPLGLPIDILTLHGFWMQRYIHIKDLIPLWWLLFLPLFYFSVLGCVDTLGSRPLRWLSLSLIVLSILAFLAAAGPNLWGVSSLLRTLWEHLPFYRLFRDSHKFVSLLCLAYAYLGAWGVQRLIRDAQSWSKKGYIWGSIATCILLIPLACGLPIYGSWGQLSPADYPEDWYQLRDYLDRDQQDYTVLVFPWHMYMPFSWLENTNQTLVNPAPSFFSQRVIAGDNLEIPGVRSNSPDPVSQYIQFLLDNRNSIDNLGELLAPLNVKYIVLWHEADYKQYDFLQRQKDLSIELTLNSLTLFRNNHFVGRAYGVDGLAYVRCWTEFSELSRFEEVMSSVYLIGEPLNYIAPSSIEPVNIQRKSPIRFKLEEVSSKWLIFSMPQGLSCYGWKFRGQQEEGFNLGLSPVFKGEGTGDIVYARFYYLYLPLYILSVLAILSSLAYLIRRR